MGIIKIENVTKVFYPKDEKKRIIAVDNLNLEIEKGEILSILGPNGAGKTSIVKICCGLLIPNKGRVLINGYDAFTHQKKTKKIIAVLLEGDRNLYWRLTAYQNLKYFGALKQYHNKEFEKWIDYILDFFELSDRKHNEVKEFSRGMKQKLSLAVALIGNPEILFLDEPTLGLDVYANRAIKNKLREISSLMQKTIIIATHQMDVARDLSNRVAILNRGKLLAIDKPESLIRLFSRQYYEIRIKGELTPYQYQSLSDLNNLNINKEEGEILVSGVIEEPHFIYKIIDILKEGTEIIAINKIEPSLEEVFLKIMGTTKQG
ncbi:MAG: ABC transporter ATP-binding protein [bacterium]